MKTCSVTEAKNDLNRLIKQAGKERILLTRRGKPAAVILGFNEEEDWLDFQLEHDPRFLQRIARARAEIRQGDFVKLEDLPD